MASSSLDKQIASCNSPHDWLVSLAMDLAVLCDIYRGENGTNRCHLAVFSVDVVFSTISWLPIHPPPPYRGASDICHAIKKSM